MYQIISKEKLSENLFKFIVKAPRIAKAHRPGNFVIARAVEDGARVPLSVIAADKKQETLTLVVQAVGVSTAKIAALNSGEEIKDIVGPLGKPTPVQQYGTVVCVGSGIGIASLLPTISALKSENNHVIAVLMERENEPIILEQEIKAIADEVILSSNHGKDGEKAQIIASLDQIFRQQTVNKVFTIGDPLMMQYVCDLTKEHSIPTNVALNAIMVDGMGMCGACRITIDGRTKFVCMDGPDFDGHQVDFPELINRLNSYSEEEKVAYTHYLKETKASDATTTDKVNEVAIDEADRIAVTLTEDDLSRDAEWRKELLVKFKPKERMAMPRVAMPLLDPVYRARQMNEEVSCGFTKEQAIQEAQRCLDCPNPGCVQGCPVHVNIPRFIKLIEKGEFIKAALSIKEISSLPAVCGRVCPQEKQCESQCIHTKTKRRAVAIGGLERFAADYQREHGAKESFIPTVKRNIKIGVVGSGPGGLSFAGEMTKRGYDVTVFEALHELGGVLKYGIPEYRLPNRIVDNEIETLERSGVKFVKNCLVGKTVTVEQLKEEGFKGLFVATGAGRPNFMNIPGENYNNILSSNEYLTRVNLMKGIEESSETPIPYGKKVIVVGGGNTAMDSVRTALRLGAASATIVYRRSEEEMPAGLEEIIQAKDEGVQFMNLHNPVSYEADDQGNVCRVILQKMELGEPDSSGRRRPVPIEGALIKMDVDLVIVAVGVSANPIFANSVEGLQLSKWGTIEVDEKQETSIPMIYAGGDITRGGATVILAMGDGKRAAAEMDAKLQQA